MDDLKFAALQVEILQTNSIEQLRSLRNQFQFEIKHIEENVSQQTIEYWNKNINLVHDAFIQRSIELAEKKLAGEGLGSPPAAYSYLLLGSGGRSEQTLASDQDSALLFADCENVEEAKIYFLTFTKQIVEYLEMLGYPPCNGKVQSHESLWCQSMTEWKTKLSIWMNHAEWEDIRYLLIVADARTIYGQSELLSQLQIYYFEMLGRHPHILKRMIENTVQYKMIIGFFGQFITDRYGKDIGQIDIKYGAYIPIVNSIRWLSISCGIKESSTLKRIDLLEKKGMFSSEKSEDIRVAVKQILALRLKAGHYIENGFYEGNVKIHPKRLDQAELKTFKKGLKVGKWLQKTIQRYIGK